MGALKNFAEGMALLALLFVTGTLLFSLFEGHNYLDSFYWTFLTITTVGSPIPAMTDLGKWLAIFLVFFGMGTVLYVVTMLAQAMIEGQTRLLLTGLKGGFARMKRERNHIILCGYGKVGKYVCDSLKKQKKRYLIIEKDPETAKELLRSGENIINGDALDQEILKKAAIEKAKVLIATLKEDADNLYLIMNASELNPDLLLAAKAVNEDAVKRMHKVGAQIVVMPDVVGGKQLAEAVVEVEKTADLHTISKKDTET